MAYDLADLNLFIAVAELGSLSKAAQRIHRSVGAASQRLRHLEAAFGTALFEQRGAHGMVLNAAGETLLRQARTLMIQAEALNAEMGAYARGVQSVVRLQANTNATNVFLPQDLAGFLAAQPQVNVLLEERPSPEIVAAVQSGAADLGIVAGQDAAPGLVFLPYRQDQLVLVAPPGHPLAMDRPRPFADALDESFISLDSASAIHAFLLAKAREAGRTLRLRTQVRSFDTLCRMASAGVGVGLVPLSAACQAAGAYPVNIIPLTDTWAPRALQIVLRPGDQQRQPVAALVAHLRQGQD